MNFVHLSRGKSGVRTPLISECIDSHLAVDALEMAVSRQLFAFSECSTNAGLIAHSGSGHVVRQRALSTDPDDSRD